MTTSRELDLEKRLGELLSDKRELKAQIKEIQDELDRIHDENGK